MVWTWWRVVSQGIVNILLKNAFSKNPHTINLKIFPTNEGYNHLTKSLTDILMTKPWAVFRNIPAGIYKLNVNNRNTRTRWEAYSKLTIKTPERRYWRHCGVFIVNFEHILHVAVFLLLTLSRLMPAEIEVPTPYSQSQTTTVMTTLVASEKLSLVVTKYY